MPSILQLVEINQTGDSYHRMRWPAFHLSQVNPDWSVVNISADAPSRYQLALEADLLVLFQCMDLDLLPIVNERKRLGLKTLVEYNDNFYHPSAWSPVAGAWSSPLLWQRYESFMQSCDGVIVTGQALADIFKKKGFTGKLHILENHLPEAPAAFEQLYPKYTDKLTLGWAGSLGHMADLIATTPLLHRALSESPNLELHLMGNSSLPSVIGIPTERLRFTEWGEMHQYFKFWHAVQLGIIPLLDTPYNQGRSDVKAVEIAGSGACPLIPDLAPYKSFLEATKLTPYKDQKDLYKKLQHYLAHPDLIRNDAERAYNYVASMRVHSLRNERQELYTSHLGTINDNWPITIGYHELVANGKSPAPLEQSEQNIKQFIRNNQNKQALILLQSERKRVPESADLALLEIQILYSAKQLEHALQACITASKLFRYDLRFLMLLVELSPTKEKLAIWSAILTDQPKNVLLGFERELAQGFAKHLIQTPELLTLEELAMKHLSEQAELRQLLADYHWRVGNAKQANLHYSWLAEQARTHRTNKEFFASSSPGYFDAWMEGTSN